MLLWALLSLIVAADTRDLAKYPDKVSLGKHTLAAEYLVHSIPQAEIIAENYLVFDAALYGEGSLALSASQFTLRINGKKDILYPQTPWQVAAAIQDPGYAGQRPQLTVGAGVGNAGVVLGGPSPNGRFPDDPTRRRPATPTTTKEPEHTLPETIELASFPEGPRKLPSSGLLFFLYRGKLKSIKTLELLYAGPAGAAALKLEP